MKWSYSSKNRCIIVCVFNNGYTDVLKIMKLGLRIGCQHHNFATTRTTAFTCRAQAATREERLRRKQSRNEAEEVAIVTEGISYALGLDALWFITKCYCFTK